jgi:hypothetical protein
VGKAREEKVAWQKSNLNVETQLPIRKRSWGRQSFRQHNNYNCPPVSWKAPGGFACTLSRSCGLNRESSVSWTRTTHLAVLAVSLEKATTKCQ